MDEQREVLLGGGPDEVVLVGGPHDGQVLNVYVSARIVVSDPGYGETIYEPYRRGEAGGRLRYGHVS